MAKRTLTEEEKRQWQHVAKTTRPLKRADLDEEAEPLPSARAKKPTHSVRLKPAAIKNPDYSHLSRGSYAGIDGNTASKFRRGKYEIDATLDLHGYRHDEARKKFIQFMRSQYAREARCLLVITGKGTKESPGLLKQMLPEWINDDNVRPMILAFDLAQQQHGGGGSYYILLKRKR